LFLPKFLLLNYMNNAHLMKHENQHPINLQDSSIFLEACFNCDFKSVYSKFMLSHSPRVVMVLIKWS